MCGECQGGLIAYGPGHPAHAVVGDVEDWDCDVCGDAFTEADAFYTCRSFDLCDWGICQGCFAPDAPKAGKPFPQPTAQKAEEKQPTAAVAVAAAFG